MSLGDQCKAFVFPLMNFTEDKNDQMGQQGGAGVSIKFYMGSVLSIVLMILAGYLAWTCNINENSLLRVLYTLLAVVFNIFYLIYYLIYRVIMGTVC